MEFKETDKNYLLSIPNKDSINISVVYSRHFFELFDFRDFHVNSFGENVPVVGKTSVPKKSTDIYQGSHDLDEDETDLIIASEIIGKEKTPDGYSQLPLEIPQKGGSIIDTVENSLNDVYDKYSKYLSLPQKKESVQKELVDPNIQSKDVRVTFPKTMFHVKPLTELMTKGSSHQSIFHFSTGFDYHEIEQLVKDITFQLQYFENEGVVFKEINETSIYKINGRYLIIDSENCTTLSSKSQKDDMNRSIYKLFISMMGKTRDDSIFMVPYTKLYYMLRRLDVDNHLLWV
jgi:hypothetical protein